MSYIEREYVLKCMDDSYKNAGISAEAKAKMTRWLKKAPAADVRPVVRGKWVGYPECLKYTNAYSDDHIVCSACEECFSILDNDCERFNFCPNCGAKMEES